MPRVGRGLMKTQQFSANKLKGSHWGWKGGGEAVRLLFQLKRKQENGLQVEHRLKV